MTDIQVFQAGEILQVIDILQLISIEIEFNEKHKTKILRKILDLIVICYKFFKKQIRLESI